ncbi:MAG: tetraacyldisaccharide 4'-kinase [Polaromonas sp.]
MTAWLARAWRKRGLAACLLWPLSLVYWGLSGLHRSLYRAGVLKLERCRVPIIVVGNVVAGGAGKTPLVIALARHLQQQGIKVGIVSRGYGRKGKQGKNCLEVLENTPISESGDEPALILRAQAAPVFIANRRIKAVNGLLEKYPSTQVIISDDGLQHHSMARDIDITVFDDRGIGNGWLLPAGPLRQPYTVSQPNQGLVLHTGQSPAFKGYVSTRQLADHALNASGHQIALASLKGQALTALAGIANPPAFFDMLRARGLQLQQTISLPDHYDFSGYAWPVSDDAVVLCTEKDAVKLFELPRFKGRKLLAVPLEFSPEPAFYEAVDALLKPLLTQPSDLPSPHGHQNGHQTA